MQAEPLSTSLRDVQETLIRSAALHIVAAASFGHLLTLRHRIKGPSVAVLFEVLGFLLFPTLPIAQLIRQCSLVISKKILRRNRSGSLSYYLCAFLGMHVVVCDRKNSTKSILELDHSKLRHKQGRYRILWLGRMAMLLLLVIQYCGTILLWVRRFRKAFGSELAMFSQVRMWDIDNKNLLIACGGLTSVLASLAISILNIEWAVQNEDTEVSEDAIELERSTISMLESGNPSTNPTIQLRSNAMSDPDDPLPLQSTNQSQMAKSFGHSIFFGFIGIGSWIQQFYCKFRALNHRLSQKLIRYYPLQLQWDLELAYLILLCFFIFFYHHDGFWGTLARDPSLIRQPAHIYNRLEYVLFHASFSFRVIPTLMKLYIAPAIILLLHQFLWMLVWPSFLKFVPRNLQAFLCELDFWFRSGRTIFSIALTNLMLFPLCLQIRFIVFDFRVINSLSLNDILEDRLTSI
jgi:hypothetical protein